MRKMKKNNAHPHSHRQPLKCQQDDYEVMDIINNINLVETSEKKPLQPNFIAMSCQGAKKAA